MWASVPGAVERHARPQGGRGLPQAKPQADQRAVPEGREGDWEVLSRHTEGRRTRDTVVRFVVQHLDLGAWRYDLSKVGEKNSYMRQFFRGAVEFSDKHIEGFVNDGFGDNQLHLSPRDLRDGFLAPSARKSKGGNEDVAIKNRPHRRRYRSRSFSVRMPFSFAFRLQKP